MTPKEKIFAFIKKHWFNGLFFTAFFILLFNTDAKAWVLQQLFVVGLFKADLQPEALQEKAAPDNMNLNFMDAHGKVVPVSDLKGKVVFINFWATWCPPCRAEMPSIHSLYKKLQPDDNFVFLMVDVDSNQDKAKQYMQQYGFDLPVYVPAGPIPQSLFNGTLPTTLVFAKDGKLVMKQEGIANYNTDAFIKKLQQL